VPLHPPCRPHLAEIVALYPVGLDPVHVRRLAIGVGLVGRGILDDVWPLGNPDLADAGASSSATSRPKGDPPAACPTRSGATLSEQRRHRRLTFALPPPFRNRAHSVFLTPLLACCPKLLAAAPPPVSSRTLPIHPGLSPLSHPFGSACLPLACLEVHRHHTQPHREKEGRVVARPMPIGHRVLRWVRSWPLNANRRALGRRSF